MCLFLNDLVYTGKGRNEFSILCLRVCVYNGFLNGRWHNDKLRELLGTLLLEIYLKWNELEYF